tara:strand:+ start:1650 stop:2060 length:411 start_codon:yes stop_codon:yes gene_type:complete
MAYKQETDSPLGHCWSNVMHLQPWNKMRSRTAAAAGRGAGNKPSLKAAEKRRESPLDKTKAKGGGTTKVCLPKAKIASMSQEERQKVINAKLAAAAAGKRVRSSSSNVTGTSSRNLKDWVKQDWRQVADPSKKCGE